MAKRRSSERLRFAVLVPAIVVAVLLLGGVALRTTLQLEKARQQTVLNATLTLADERVDHLDKLLIAQDNVVATHVDLANVGALARRWLATASRETPTVRAVLVLEMSSPDHDVVAFVSRAPGREDDAFRRTLVAGLLQQLNYAGDTSELRHLHTTVEQQSILLSYWQRSHEGKRYLVVAWHDVPRIVHDLMPRLYRDADRADHRMNVVDEEGRIVFGPPIKGGEFTVGRPFPTTLDNWRMQIALTTAEQLRQKVERQRMLELAMVVLAAVVAIAGVAIVVLAAAEERRLASLKSDFAANVSHELKTPLALVRMFGEMLLAGRVASEEKRRQYLQIIVSESERLTALIDNVLDFAKVERGKAAYDFSLGRAEGAVARAVDVLRHRAERDGVELTLDVAAGLPDVRHDGRALELAVINLVDNALKYGKGGGRIEVSVREAGARVQIAVTDHGPGIHPDDLERIFERFVRGRKAQEGQVRGSGIGLSLVRHIAEAHGGRVQAVSPATEDGLGSRFELELPAVRGTSRAPPRA